MKTIASFSYPFVPPTINQSYEVGKVWSEERHTYVHRIIATKELRDFKEQATDAIGLQKRNVNWELVEEIKKAKKSRKDKNIKIRVDILTTLPDNRKDVDNAKAIQDTAFKFLGINDGSVFSCHIQKCTNKEDVGTTILIRTLPDNVFERLIRWFHRTRMLQSVRIS